MFFQSKGFGVDLVDPVDVKGIVDVYNSNKKFLASHMDKEKVTEEWVLEELNSMKEIGFSSCKIFEISSGKIIGVLDFRISEETYLSLLMINNDFKGKGIGKLIFQAFADYLKSLSVKFIKIDVVTNYDNSILDFWIKNGFIEWDYVELNWAGKMLPAITMKKSL